MCVWLCNCCLCGFQRLTKDCPALICVAALLQALTLLDQLLERCQICFLLLKAIVCSFQRTVSIIYFSLRDTLLLQNLTCHIECCDKCLPALICIVSLSLIFDCSANLCQYSQLLFVHFAFWHCERIVRRHQSFLRFVECIQCRCRIRCLFLCSFQRACKDCPAFICIVCFLQLLIRCNQILQFFAQILYFLLLIVSIDGITINAFSLHENHCGYRRYSHFAVLDNVDCLNACLLVVNANLPFALCNAVIIVEVDLLWRC